MGILVFTVNVLMVTISLVLEEREEKPEEVVSNLDVGR